MSGEEHQETQPLRGAAEGTNGGIEVVPSNIQPMPQAAQQAQPQWGAENAASKPTTAAQPQAQLQSTPSYSTEEMNFHKCFPSVPLNEKLVQDYGCSLSRKKLLRPGRLFVTAVRLCFLPSISASCEPVNVMWQDVKGIHKKTKVIVGMLEVETSTTTLSFTAFSYGVIDGAHKTLQMLVSVRSKYGPAPTAPAPAVAAPPVERQMAATPPASDLVDVKHSRTRSDPPPVTEASSTPPSQPALISSHSFDPSMLSPMEKQSSPTSSASPETGKRYEPVEASARDNSIEQVERSVSQDADTGAVPPPVENTSVASTGSAELRRQNMSLGASPEATQEPAARSKEASPTPFSPKADTPTVDNDSGSLSGGATATGYNTVPTNDGSSDGSSLQVTPASPPTDLKSGLNPQMSPIDGGLREDAKTPSPNGKNLSPTAAGASNNASQQSTPPPISLNGSSNEAANQRTPAAKDPSTSADNNNGPQKTVSNLRPSEKGPSKSRRSTIREDGPDADGMTKANSDVLKHFPKVPKTENVLDAFQCSYVAGVHRIGKMYITGHYMLFNSMLLAESIAIPFSDMRSVTKQQTILVLDGIVVTTRSGDKYEFTSFLSRDSAFSILKQLFDTHRATQTVARGMVADKEVDEKNMDKNTVGPEPDSPPAPVEDVTTNTSAAPMSPNSAPVPLAASLSSPTTNGTSSTSSAGILPMKTTTFGPAVSPFDYPAAATADAWDAHGTEFEFSDMKDLEGSKVVFEDYKFPKGCDLNDVFRVVFDDDTPVNLDYHVARKETENVWEKWKPCTPVGTATTAPVYSGQRTFNCITIIKAPLATACPFTEFQKFVALNVAGKPTIFMGLSGQARGVMYSETFRVEQLMRLTQEGSGADAVVTLNTTCTMRWYSQPWIKKKIIANSYSECRAGLEKLVTFIVPALEKDLATRPSVAAVERPVLQSTPNVASSTPLTSPVGQPSTSPAGFSPRAQTTSAATSGTSSVLQVEALPLPAAMVAKGLLVMAALFLFWAAWCVVMFDPTALAQLTVGGGTTADGASMLDVDPQGPTGKVNAMATATASVQPLVDITIGVIGVLKPLALGVVFLLLAVIPALWQRVV